MTTVHVNRSLQRLRRDELIVLKDGILTILDFERLAELCGFTLVDDDGTGAMELVPVGVED